MSSLDPLRVIQSSGEPAQLAQDILAQVTLGVSRLHPFARRSFFVALVLFVISSVALVLTFFDRFYVDVPMHGGRIVEGIIDRPRYINPVLARTSADKNLTALVYSGLMRISSDGSALPDLAESYTKSENGLVYTFTLRPGLLWHDGRRVTADDVLYTIEKILDPGLEIKSPRRASWEGVEVSSTDERTIVFTLKQPYSPFLENATVGILPKHIWGEISDNEFDVSYYNLDPIGTGPYRVVKIIQDDKKGLPLSYELKAFPGYALGRPYITDFTMRFFGNNKDLLQAYQGGVITRFPTVDPEIATTIEASSGRITRMHLPLLDAAFFNQNQQPLFVDKKVRIALAAAIDKDRIVREVLMGYGTRVDGPISALTADVSDDRKTGEWDPTVARQMLIDAGWSVNADTGILEKIDKKTKKAVPLEFSLTVPDVSELRRVAEIMKENWDAIGARTTVKVFETGTFGSEVLGPRKYDVLLYGIIGRASDPYPYWHSSQRNSPGVNVSNYTSRTADDLLEKIRKEGDPVRRAELLVRLEETILDDMPAVFLYSPDLLYATDASAKGLAGGYVLVESDRFNDVHNWSIMSDRIWFFLEPFARRSSETESRVSLALWKYFSGNKF